jgi:hypothetical protein
MANISLTKTAPWKAVTSRAREVVGAASPLNLMQAAELICPQAQSGSIAIFYANHVSLIISQRSTD